MRKEFLYTFIVNRMTVFEVDYYTLGNNRQAHFSTSAARFNRPKTDWNFCGQCQNEVLKGKARSFYLKWDVKHLHDLTDMEYTELLEDIEELKRVYPLYIENIKDSFAGTNPQNSFYETKKLSMQYKK